MTAHAALLVAACAEYRRATKLFAAASATRDAAIRAGAVRTGEHNLIVQDAAYSAAYAALHEARLIYADSAPAGSAQLLLQLTDPILCVVTAPAMASAVATVFTPPEGITR